MENSVYLEIYSVTEEMSEVKLSLESFITYCIYTYCSPEITLNFVVTGQKNNATLNLDVDIMNNIVNKDKIPWQVASCVYPVAMYGDTIITGLCAVARHISKHCTVHRCSHEHDEGLLGFRKSCLQAPNEVSIWTKFCEVDLIKTVSNILNVTTLTEVPKNLVRFENHLNKPVRVHNVYKIARELRKENIKNFIRDPTLLTEGKPIKDTVLDTKVIEESKDNKQEQETRVPKIRKWKSNFKKGIEIDSSTKIEDLEVSHRFAEGHFLTLADLVLVPSYYIVIQSIGEAMFQTLLPLTYKWFINIMEIDELKSLIHIFNRLQHKKLVIHDVVVPKAEDVSLYKCDPKRHNPRKRMFTKEEDVESALSKIMEGMELKVHNDELEPYIDWKEIPEGANPNAGHLPEKRVVRKAQQLENLVIASLNVVKDGDLIVDFCSGSGHLGILIAYLLPKCTVILLENKEQSLLNARNRIHEMKLKNVYFFQCNLDFFIGKFDIGIALHACGVASDLVLDKCLKANAKFVICPCCYGSLHATDRLIYPRSRMFSNVPLDQYLCIGHAADQTHEEHPLTVRGERCMAVIDSDRARLAEEFGYDVKLSRLQPLSCTPKNNLIVGVPS